MDTKVMKTFCDLADTGSFSRTAEANNITQSAVSQQLARLEAAFSTQLLSRSGGLVVPTEAGKAFYRGVKEILRRYDQMIAEMKSAVDSAAGALRVGTIYSVGLYLLHPYIREFLQAYPEVNLRVEYTGWDRITAAVLAGEMDLGVVAYPDKHRSIEIIPFMDEKLVVVCSPDHPLAGRKHIGPADLAGRKFIAFEANIPTRRNIDRILNSFHVKVDVAMEFDNIDTLKRAVEVNAGLSILPRDNIERELAEGHLVCVPFRDPARWVRKIAILRRRGKARSKAEHTFLKLLRPGK